GADVVSYGDMMRQYAALRGLRRFLVPVPILTPHLSGLWLALVTPSQSRIGRALVEGLRNSTVVRSPDAREWFSIPATPLRDALATAIAEGAAARLRVHTRITDVAVPPTRAFAPIRRIGGASGWYFLNLLWRIRGWMDDRVGGVGMRRGRADPDACGTGDVIDGWTVESFEPDRRLRLSSDWKLPGRGWLEFEVTPLDNGTHSRIRQTATFDPRGLTGRAYWLALVPLHSLLFRGLLQRIAERALRDEASPDGAGKRLLV
ncbi:MAG: SDR family oxidoreductase, partial [Vicinamibacterales bacterium]